MNPQDGSLTISSATPVYGPMTLADVPAVGELEPLCFPAPWSADTYRNELLHNQFGRYRLLRAPEGSEENLPPILAYGGYWLMGDEVHIVTIASHPQCRRQGYGELLLLYMLEEARSEGAMMVTLEVRVSNQAAQSLYAKHGFIEVGLRRAYYRDNNEDALLMTLFFPEASEAGA